MTSPINAFCTSASGPEAPSSAPASEVEHSNPEGTSPAAEAEAPKASSSRRSRSPGRSSATRKVRTIRRDAERILARSSKPYPAVVVELKRLHPDANPTLASVRWYASRMRKEGKEVKARPRAA